ncbi:MAG: tyrosine--tRNA ligase [Candidatus Porifericomitaceae bacterium WSBS_2022_MAG_OTU9]
MNSTLDEELKRGTSEILIEQDLAAKLTEGKPLCIKAGFDPTAPDLHLGHTLILNKMRQFQQLGHEVVFLIGDFTGRIGDPSGRNATRPPLSLEEVLANADTYREQVGCILDMEHTKVRFNSEWMDKMNSQQMLELASRYTVSRMLERDDFKKRYGKEGHEIRIMEFFYPLVQGYDSVALQSDLELGGTDQKFNLLVGRHLQKEYGQRPQDIMMLPLLEGLEGVRKMSKSYDNYIGIREDADSMYGKLMSISDTLMWRYLELLSFRSLAELQQLKQQAEQGRNPRDIKHELAMEITARFHDCKKAEAAKGAFIERFQNKQTPEEVPLVQLPPGDWNLAAMIKEAGLAPSTSEARRLVQQGAVRVNGHRMEDPLQNMVVEEELLLQVGKRRIAKIIIAAGS